MRCHTAAMERSPALRSKVFSFAKDLLDRLQVGAVGRQEQQMRASFADGSSDRLAFVAAQIVEHDDVAGVWTGVENWL
jgi:hypothetical protein